MAKRPKYKQSASGVYVPVMEEDQLQIRIVHMMKIDFLPEDLMFCHCPNGGNRHVKEAMKLKAMGVLPGMSDLLCWWPAIRGEEWRGEPFMDSGLIELKTESVTSVLSDEQKAVRKRVVAMNGKFAVARNYQTVRDTLIGWGVRCQRKIILASLAE